MKFFSHLIDNLFLLVHGGGHLLLNRLQVSFVLPFEHLDLTLVLVCDLLGLFTDASNLFFLSVDSLAHLFLHIQSNLCLFFINAVQLCLGLGTASFDSAEFVSLVGILDLKVIHASCQDSQVFIKHITGFLLVDQFIFDLGQTCLVFSAFQRILLLHLRNLKLILCH